MGIIQEKITQLVNQKRDYKLPKADKGMNAVIYAHNLDEIVYLNGEVLDDEKKLIYCRHLSYLVALKDIRKYHHLLQDAATLGQQQELKYNVYDNENVATSSSHYYVFPLEKFGEQLHQLAKELKKGIQETFLLNTEKHILAVSIKHKKNDSYIVKYYDPHPTNTHLRALCEDLSAVKPLSIDDFLEFREGEEEGKKDKALYCPNIELLMFSYPNSKRKNQQRCVKLLVDNLTVQSQILFYAVRRKWPDIIFSSVQAVLTSNLADSEKIKQLDKVGNDADFSHFLNSNKEALLLDYTKLISQSTLSKKEQRRFLEPLVKARDSKGLSVLCYAIIKGDQEAMQIYTQLMVDFQFIMIMNHKDDFSYCLNNNKEESLVGYTKLILQSTLSKKEQCRFLKPLVKARNSEGLSVLNYTIIKGDQEAMQIYTQLMVDFKIKMYNHADFSYCLNNNKKVELLDYIQFILQSTFSKKEQNRFLKPLVEASDRRGLSVHGIAIINGNKEAIQFYSKLIVDAPYIYLDHTDFSYCLSNNKEAELLDYTQFILQSKLSKEEQFYFLKKVIEAKDKNDLSALSHALIMGNKEAVQIYTQLIKDIPFNSREQYELLVSSNVDALAVAFSNGQRDLVIFFVNELSQSSNSELNDHVQSRAKAQLESICSHYNKSSSTCTHLIPAGEIFLAFSQEKNEQLLKRIENEVERFCDIIKNTARYKLLQKTFLSNQSCNLAGLLSKSYSTQQIQQDNCSDTKNSLFQLSG